MSRSATRWRTKVVETPGRRCDLSGAPEALQRVDAVDRREQSDRTVAISDLDRLTGCDAPKQFARPLPKLSDACGTHVLLVAHSGGRRADKRVRSGMGGESDALHPTGAPGRRDYVSWIVRALDSESCHSETRVARSIPLTSRDAFTVGLDMRRRLLAFFFCWFWAHRFYSLLCFHRRSSS